jgi:hypothetical protein
MSAECIKFMTTLLLANNHQKSVTYTSLGHSDEVNAAAGIPPCNIPTEGTIRHI